MKTREPKKQTKLAIDTEQRFRGSDKWMLVFKVSDRKQPLVVVGSLETVYEQFTQLSEQFTAFVFATLYAPHGRIHRSWGKPRKWM